jgi:hypothetical protein
VDTVLDKVGGIARFLAENDVVVIKVRAQWWNQRMTNVAAAKRLVDTVGLIDAGHSALADAHWYDHDHEHEHGVYGGDGRGPLAEGDDRDGYHWDPDLLPPRQAPRRR